MEARKNNDRAKDEMQKVRQILFDEYKAEKMIELEIDIMKVNINIRSSVLEQIYRDGDLKFVQKYIKDITPKLRNEILVTEYRKGNTGFVYANFGNIDNGDLKDAILNKEVKEKNYQFLYNNYDYIYNRDLREKIIRYAYKEENVDFLNKHLEDMPKNLKLEAAIKFKNLKLSKEELAELLKR